MNEMLFLLFVSSRNGKFKLYTIACKCQPLIVRLRQVSREVDAPFIARHSEYNNLYNELVNEKNSYEQAFNVESDIDNYQN